MKTSFSRVLYKSSDTKDSSLSIHYHVRRVKGNTVSESTTIGVSKDP